MAEETLRPELADLRRLARRAVRGVVGVARADERVTLKRVLDDHLGRDAAGLGVVQESWADYDHVNVQAGLDAWLETAGRSHELVGVIGFQHTEFGLAELLAEGHDHYGPRPGNVARVNLPCGPDGEVRPCVRCGVYLVSDGRRRTVVLLRGSDPESGMSAVTVEIVSPEAEYAGQAAAEIRSLAVEHNVFRSQVLSFGREMFGHGRTLLRFHHRPQVPSSDLVLAEEVFEAIHRQVVEVARHQRQLLDAGQHLKRGLLLYGPPGVGKTHTVRYLVGNLTRTTVILLSGDSLHLIAEACSVARVLQPAMLVVEDVDLIAEDRGMHPGHHPMLFQLLNEMDGLEEVADVVFVLTTNRADLLEPALASRPGRVDQAVELTLPDLAARRQLFELYRGGLVVDAANVDDVLARTEGVTASFLKELLRRSAVLAAARTSGDDGQLTVSTADLDAALAELLDTRNAMTRVLLGAAATNGG